MAAIDESDEEKAGRHETSDAYFSTRQLQVCNNKFMTLVPDQSIDVLCLRYLIVHACEQLLVARNLDLAIHTY